MYKLIPNDTLSKEMQLILASSKAAFSINTQSNNLSDNIDSEKLYKLLCYHSIRPIFLKGLTKIDSSLITSQYSQQLKQDCHQISIRSLLNAQELIRLLKIFNSKNISIVPYKGANVAQTYYRDLGLRESSDIDLFVDVKDIPLIKKILIEEHYKPEFTLDKNQEKLYLLLNCEYNFDLSDEKNNRFFHIEPHYLSNGIIDNISPLSLVDFKKNLLKSNMGGDTISILSPTDNLLLILTHHAIKEGWSKLKYILDIHQIVQKDGGVINWDYLSKKIEDIGIKKQAFVGFSLTHILFSTPFPNQIISQFSDLNIQHLVAERIKELNQFERSIHQRYLKIFIFNLKCKNGLFFKLKYILCKIGYPTGGDIAIIALPKYLWFLYPFIRLSRLIPKFFKK